MAKTRYTRNIPARTPPSCECNNKCRKKRDRVDNRTDDDKIIDAFTEVLSLNPSLVQLHVPSVSDEIGRRG